MRGAKTPRTPSDPAAGRGEVGTSRVTRPTYPADGGAWGRRGGGIVRRTARTRRVGGGVQGLASFGRLFRRNLRSLIVIGACILLSVLPLLLWLDYLRSIYRSMMVVHDGQITAPLWGVAWKLRSIWSDAAGGLAAPQMIASVFAVIAWAARTAWTGRLLMTPDRWAPWTLVGLAYAVMSLTMHPVVWEGSPGAFTRVLLPLAVATNVTMAMRRDVPWAMIVAANLDVVPGIWLLVTGG